MKQIVGLQACICWLLEKGAAAAATLNLVVVISYPLHLSMNHLQFTTSPHCFYTRRPTIHAFFFESLSMLHAPLLTLIPSFHNYFIGILRLFVVANFVLFLTTQSVLII